MSKLIYLLNTQRTSEMDSAFVLKFIWLNCTTTLDQRIGKLTRLTTKRWIERKLLWTGRFRLLSPKLLWFLLRGKVGQISPQRKLSKRPIRWDESKKIRSRVGRWTQTKYTPHSVWSIRSKKKAFHFTTFLSSNTKKDALYGARPCSLWLDPRSTVKWLDHLLGNKQNESEDPWIQLLVTLFTDAHFTCRWFQRFYLPKMAAVDESFCDWIGFSIFRNWNESSKSDQVISLQFGLQLRAFVTNC